MKREASYHFAKVSLILIFAIFFSRVFFLTVMMRSYFDDQASDNMLSREKLAPIRGIISDRNGKPLAMNIENEGRTVRFYPGGETIAGIVGYLGKPSEKELNDCAGLCSGDALLGKAGLEKEYEKKLRGVPGEVLIRETASGKERTEIKRTNSIPGEVIKTNIDSELQTASFVALKNALKTSGKSGAMVIAKVSGEILVFASSPSYDPNLFVPGGKRSDFGGDYKDVTDILKDTDKKPLYVRPLSGDFAPGSIYKLTPAIAALEEGKITRDTMVNDTGEIKIGEYRFGNWYLDKYGKVEGNIDVITALSRSNDIFFYKTGEALGADLLISWTKKFGLGEYTNIDLPGESKGFVPTPYWREKTLGERWFLGNTYHMSIGQGDLMATPIQMNRMTASIVSGVKCEPRLAGKGDCTDMKLNPKNISIVLEGMKGACSTGGTAFPLFGYGGRIYCKTGTAQKGGINTVSNAWISVVVPTGGNVQEWLVITVLVEEGGEGSAVAAPIVKEILPLILR